MKNIIFISILSLMFFINNGCMMLMMPGMMDKMNHSSGNGDSFQKHKTHIENEITEILNKQISEWNNGSLEGYMSTYEKSDSVIFASGGKIIYGWNTVLERFQKRYTSKDSMGVLTFSDLKVEAFSNSSAMAFGRWKVDRKINAFSGLFTLILKKKNNDWLVVHDHTSME